jgi:hypothetical protein
MNGVLDLLQSKRFLSALMGIAFMVVVVFVPQFNGYEEEFISTTTAVVIFLISGFTLTEVLRHLASRPGVSTLVSEIVGRVMDAMELQSGREIPDDLEELIKKWVKEAVESAALEIPPQTVTITQPDGAETQITLETSVSVQDTGAKG